MENTTPKTIREKLEAFKKAQKRRDYALMQEIMAWPEFHPPTFSKAKRQAKNGLLVVATEKQADPIAKDMVADFADTLTKKTRVSKKRGKPDTRRSRLDAVRKGLVDPLELARDDYKAYCGYIAKKAREANHTGQVSCGQCGVRGISMHAHHIVPMKELVKNKTGHLIESHKFFWCCSDCHAVLHENEHVHKIIKSRKSATRTRLL